MEDLILVRASKDLQFPIWDYRKECLNNNETRINGACGINYFNDFDEWLELVLSIEEDKLSRENVHATTFFSIRKSDNKIIGSIQLRHTLTDALAKHGGHIGYEIRPSERRKGYAIQQLMLVLEEAKKIGLTKVMVSCDKENIGSAKTILKCGGILEDESINNSIIEQVYWINL